MKVLPLLTLALLFATATDSLANDWPTWRGPQGDGKLPDSASYPTRWSETENLRWKIELPSPGNASPIVVGDKLFLTLSEEAGHQRSLICYDVKDGRQLWKKTVNFEADEITHKTNPWSSASPVSDGSAVFAWHGNAGLYAYDLDGQELWHRDLGKDYVHQWGPNAGSPVVHENTLILLTGPGSRAELHCLDLSTGKTIWELPLPKAESQTIKEYKGSWATPSIINNHGRDELLIPLPQTLHSFDPATGEEFWRCQGLSDLCYTNAIANDRYAIYLCGYGGPGLGLELPPLDIREDITASHRRWIVGGKDGQKKVNPQRIGSGQIIGEHLYLLNEPGAAECIEVATGNSLWKERLGRVSWSSMNDIGGKLYVNDKGGTTYVLKPNPEKMEILATNPIGGTHMTNSTLAFANGVIYLRTYSHLYAFSEE